MVAYRAGFPAGSIFMDVREPRLSVWQTRQYRSVNSMNRARSSRVVSASKTMRSLINLKPTGTSFSIPSVPRTSRSPSAVTRRFAPSRPAPLRRRSASRHRTRRGPSEACLPSRPPIRSLLSPGEGRLQRALFLSKRYKQPVPRENHPPAELLERSLDPGDTPVSVEFEGLEVDLDPYAHPGCRCAPLLSPVQNPL